MNISMRIRFSRGDVAKFISHLDMVKVFERATRRANLPVAYSQGFNPHPRIVFGLPAAVGTASRGEYADFDLAAEIGPALFAGKLNEHLPDSIRVMAAAVKKTGQNIMASVAAAEYTLEICSDAGNMVAEEDISEKLKMLLEKDCIKISGESRNKGGTISHLETDIRPLIVEASLISADGTLPGGGNHRLTGIRAELRNTGDASRVGEGSSLQENWTLRDDNAGASPADKDRRLFRYGTAPDGVAETLTAPGGYGGSASDYIIRAILKAGSKANLRPDLFAKVLKEYAGIPVDLYGITRENLYVEKDGKLFDPMDRAVLMQFY